MEAIAVLSVAASIVSVIDLSNQIYKLCRNARTTANPKMERLHYNVMVERQRTITWSDRAPRNKDGSFDLDPQTTQILAEILDQMQSYYAQVEKKMEVVRYAPDGRMSTRMFMRRVALISGGLPELEDVIQCLHAMNNVLEAMAPPLVGPTGEHVNRSLDLKSAMLGKARLKESRSSISQLPTEDARVEVQLPVSVKDCFLECLMSLRVLGNEMHSSKISKLIEQLTAWGAGQFDGEDLALDVVLTALSSRIRLRNIVLKVLCFILVDEGELLRDICATKALQHEHLDSRRNAIVRLLSCDELKSMAVTRRRVYRRLGQSESSLKQSDSQERLKTSKQTAESDIEVGLKATSISIGDGTTQVSDTNPLGFSESADVNTGMLSLPEDELGPGIRTYVVSGLCHSVPSLFKLSPMLRSLRLAQILRSERLGLTKPQAPGATLVSTKHSGPQPVSYLGGLTVEQLMDHGLKLAAGLETMLRNDESWAKTSKDTIQVWSPDFHAECARLQDFRDSRLQTLSHDEIETVVRTVGTLSTALSETLNSIDGYHKESAKITSDNPLDPMVDTRIKSVMELLRDTNEKLWQDKIRHRTATRSAA